MSSAEGHAKSLTTEDCVPALTRSSVTSWEGCALLGEFPLTFHLV